MRSIISILLIALFLLGCAQNMTIEGKTYKPYGVLNEDDHKNPKIDYEPCWGNIIWGCVLVETIIVPIYVFGFNLFEPVGKKDLLK